MSNTTVITETPVSSDTLLLYVLSISLLSILRVTQQLIPLNMSYTQHWSNCASSRTDCGAGRSLKLENLIQLLGGLGSYLLFGISIMQLCKLPLVDSSRSYTASVIPV